MVTLKNIKRKFKRKLLQRYIRWYYGLQEGRGSYIALFIFRKLTKTPVYKVYRHRIFQGIKVEKRDIWIGVFWKKILRRKHGNKGLVSYPVYQIYICLIPCLPILIEIEGKDCLRLPNDHIMDV